MAQTREIVCTRKVIADVVARGYFLCYHFNENSFHFSTAGLNVTEVAHDYQPQVSRFVTNELHATNSYDTWHGKVEYLTKILS